MGGAKGGPRVGAVPSLADSRDKKGRPQMNPGPFPRITVESVDRVRLGPLLQMPRSCTGERGMGEHSFIQASSRFHAHHTRLDKRHRAGVPTNCAALAA